jgi:hypothetical protein
MDWQPNARITADRAVMEPTKPSKPGSVGFEGSTPKHNSIIGPLENADSPRTGRVEDIMDTDLEPEPTKPTEVGIGGSECANSTTLFIPPEERLTLDPYADRMDAMLRQIALPTYPEGMILWLETAHPDLYEELTSRLPDEISRLWNTGAPLEEFEGVLGRLVGTHREGCRLYCWNPPAPAAKARRNDSASQAGMHR